MTTTTIFLGWSGNSDPRDERKFNETIVMRTNRVLEKLSRGTCWIDGNACTLTLGCNVEDARTVSHIAEAFRNAAHCGESVRETQAELIEDMT